MCPQDLPIGFNFVFDGTTYTTLKATSNGYLSFGTLTPGTFGSTYFNNLSSPTAATADKPLIAPLWDDMNGHTNTSGTSPSASCQTTGTAPNRVFTFEWLNWDWTYTATVSSISFQVKLYEGSNQIAFIYRPEANAPLTPSASIGLASGSIAGCTSSFLSLSNSSTAPVASSVTENAAIATPPVSGQTYTFTPPPPSTNTCVAVRCANISNITGNSAVVNFNGSSSATSYTVTYQATGGPVQTVTPAPIASPVNLTGLAINTTYTVIVTAHCASGASTPVTLVFTTSNGYCTTGLGGGCGGNDITDVSIIGTTLVASGLTCNTTAGGAYTNYPATGSTTGTVLRGVTYPISVTVSGSSYISAWIDFNHNLVFEPNEWVQVDVITTSVAGTPSVASITIPGTVAGSVPPTYNGPTGFRVRSRVVLPNGAIDACTNFGSGETKDFTITIAPEPPCPAPTGLTVTGISTTNATLNYTSVGAGTYTIIYGTLGFNPAVPGAGTSVTQTTTTTGAMTVPVTNLQAGTTYQFYVATQLRCGRY